MNGFNERLYFFSDVDGTLLHNKMGKYEPSVHNALTIQNFVGRGHAFVMATGRGIADVRKIAKKLNIPVEYAITYNGAFIYKNQKEISSNTLTADQINLIMAMAKQSQIKYNEALLYVENGDVYSQANNFFGSVRKLAMSLTPHKKVKPWKKSTLGKLERKRLRIPKICFSSYNRHAIMDLEHKLQLLFGDRLSIYCSSSNFLEICDAGVDKASAIRLIMNRESIPMEHTAFVGDSGNDMAAFLDLKHTYVMSHAAPEYVLEKSIITPAVADAISHFVDVYRYSNGR